MTAKEAQLETTTQAIMAAEMKRVKELTRQEAELEQQKSLQVARDEQQRLQYEAQTAREIEREQQEK